MPSGQQYSRNIDSDLNSHGPRGSPGQIWAPSPQTMPARPAHPLIAQNSGYRIWSPGVTKGRRINLLLRCVLTCSVLWAHNKVYAPKLVVRDVCINRVAHNFLHLRQKLETRTPQQKLMRLGFLRPPRATCPHGIIWRLRRSPGSGMRWDGAQVWARKSYTELSLVELAPSRLS